VLHLWAITVIASFVSGELGEIGVHLRLFRRRTFKERIREKVFWVGNDQSMTFSWEYYLGPGISLRANNANVIRRATLLTDEIRYYLLLYSPRLSSLQKS